jgi:inosine-uridine nucleoside N-ribohydrolase
VIWVDTDIALGAERGDVDDGFAIAAILAAAGSGHASVGGISTVFGNANAALSERCARRISAEAGVAPPIVMGAQAPRRDSAAGKAIAALPAGTDLLCLGPLTNVAAACRRDPSLPARVSLRVVGGNLSSRGFLAPLWPFEFNLAKDRAAAREVLRLPWKSLTLYPLDVVRRLRADAARLDRAAQTGPLGAALARGSRRWLARARRRRLSRSFALWDLPAALDTLGMLPGAARGPRELAPGIRRFLRVPRPVPCLLSFDAAGAWERFLSLLLGESFTTDALFMENGAS